MWWKSDPDSHQSQRLVMHQSKKIAVEEAQKLRDVDAQSEKRDPDQSLRIDSKEPIPPGCVAWRAGTTTLFLLGS
jgi:hypothetical protein